MTKPIFKNTVNSLSYTCKGVVGLVRHQLESEAKKLSALVAFRRTYYKGFWKASSRNRLEVLHSCLKSPV